MPTKNSVAANVHQPEALFARPVAEFMLVSRRTHTVSRNPGRRGRLLPDGGIAFVRLVPVTAHPDEAKALPGVCVELLLVLLRGHPVTSDERRPIIFLPNGGVPAPVLQGRKPRNDGALQSASRDALHRRRQETSACPPAIRSRLSPRNACPQQKTSNAGEWTYSSAWSGVTAIETPGVINLLGAAAFREPRSG